METLFTGLHTNYKTDEGNLFVFSSIHEFSREWPDGLPEATVRYVISGHEQYYLNGETVRVDCGKFLLVNKSQPHNAYMPYTSERASGFCVGIHNSMLNDVYHNNIVSDISLLDNPFTTTKKEFDFYDGIYEPSDTVNRYLSSLESKLNVVTGVVAVAQDELFFNIAERLLISQTLIRKKVSSIKASKHSTRQELYKRIAKAKRILDEENGNELPVAKIAAMVALSEFHFYRTFKQIHNVTPHQYRIKRRLQSAREKLYSTNIPVTQVSLESGFADVQSFSKAFRKEFSVSPLCFRHAGKSMLYSSAGTLF